MHTHLHWPKAPLTLAFALCGMGFAVAYASPLWAITLTSSPTIALQPESPLAAVLEFSTDVPTTASFRVHAASEAWIVESSELKTEHSIPVFGLAPDTSYTFDRLQLSASGGNVKKLDASLAATTAPLPDDFPGYEIITAKPDRMEPGLTVFSTLGYTPAVDAAGVVRWFLKADIGPPPLQENGRLLGHVRIDGNREIREYDLFGNVTAAWHSADVVGSPGSVMVAGALDFHHDQIRLANGNLLVIGRDDHLVDNFPTSQFDPDAPTATALVQRDIIYEFTPGGEVVGSWDLAEILDPLRVGYGFERESPNPQDWSHSNAVVHDPKDDSILVSVRHQDAVIKFDRATGNLIWILGPHENWGPEFQPYLLHPTGEGEFEWSYHTHSPMILPDDPGNPDGPDDPDVLTVLIHDNGNWRASPFDTWINNPDNYTRAVEYRIDEQDMSIEQTWAYGSDAEEVYYSPTQGDADWMPETNNVLIDFADVRFIDGEVQPARTSRIVEVDREGDVVFALRTFHQNNEEARATSYRAERIPSLYVGSEYSTTAIEGLVGDFTGDDAVDGTDFLSWQRGESLVVLSNEDLDDWETYFGSAVPPRPANAVPEPSSILSLTLAIALMYGRRFVRR